MAPGWQSAAAGLPQGINLAAASARTAVPEPSEPVTYPVDLDIGEVAGGYHLIVRSISLTDENLLFDYVFVPELTEAARREVWPEMNYGADVSPPGWNVACSDGEVYERPPLEARHVWFDFFPPDYLWSGQPDSDYLRNRISRLTFDLKTGEERIEK